jgi:hypothetical protein
MSAARDPQTPDFRRSHIVEDETAVTNVVLDAMAGAADPRLREIMTSLVRHLHDFAREVC